MSDITDELHRYATMAMPGYPHDVCSRAKAEIEQLRADGSAARASIGRLVAGLVEIVFHYPKTPAAAIVRQVLGGKVEDGSG